MASYNLTKPEDREQYRKDHADELAACKDGSWPRDINDDMRWIHANGNLKQRQAYAARMCQSAIDYIDGLEKRIAEGDPEVSSFEPRTSTYGVAEV